MRGSWVWSGGSDASPSSRFLAFGLLRLNQCGGVCGGGVGFTGCVFMVVCVRFASFRWWFRVCVFGRVWRGGYCRLSISFMGCAGGVVGEGLVDLFGPVSVGLADLFGLCSVVNG